jgi:hypothetical protein
MDYMHYEGDPEMCSDACARSGLDVHYEDDGPHFEQPGSEDPQDYFFAEEWF